MKYYLHSTTSFQDEKIAELFLEFGYEGLGLFYTLLEKVALQEKPIKTVVLKSQLKVGKKLEKCWKFMEQIELISSNNGETFNEQLLKFSEKYHIKNEKNNDRIRQWRECQRNEKNVTRYEHVRNASKDKISKDKISKVNNKEETIQERSDFFCSEVEKFSDQYPREMLNDFIRHWIENNGNEMKWEIAKKKGGTFQIAGRLVTWKRNDKKFYPEDKNKSKIEKLIEANQEIKIDYEKLGKK